MRIHPSVLSSALPLGLLLALSGCSKPADPAATAPSAAVATPAASPSGTDAGAAGAAQPAAAVAPVTDNTQITVAWSCDGKPVTAVYDNGKGEVRLSVGSDALTLPEAMSGSGARYADAAGNEYWEHQGEATLTLAGGKPQSCTKATSPGG